MKTNFHKNLIKRLNNILKKEGEISDRDFFKIKNEFSAENKVPNLKNIDLIHAYREMTENGEITKNTILERLISVRKVRSESGVSVITCLTKPFACPGQCIYCPTEKNMPKSYLSNQPAAMRAVLNKFHPFNQVQNRLASLMTTGHDTSKIEIIVIGGTWSFLPKQYQTYFIKGIYDGLNQKVNTKEIEKYGSFFKVPKIARIEKSKTLAEAISKNEKADYRCVGMTLETRPDFIDKKEVKRLRGFGCTRVEIGVQSLFDDVQEVTKRGHTRAQTAEATKLLKDAGFKISYHLMPGLPGSNLEKDIETVRLTFEDERFQPDLIKFYPCVVTPYTKLQKIWDKGLFKPYGQEDLKPILMKMKALVPKWCRITRLVRDIPSESIIDGCKIINLRQLIHEDMKKQKIKCKCIRCREIKGEKIDLESTKLVRENFKSCGGDEIYLTFDDVKKDKLISLLRLRIPSQYFEKKKHFIPELEGCAIIREVHTYGIHTRVGEKSGNSQHYGFGKKLLKEAEKIAMREYGLKKVAVIAGVGVRGYYEKNGYKLKGTYMIKILR